MTVKDCLSLAAAELGLSDLLEGYIAGTGSTTAANRAGALLLKCYNLVENELALDYLPLTAEDEIQTQTGTVEYSALSRDAVRILQVTDENGETVKYRLFPKYLKAQPWKLKIVYTYTPKEKGLEDECECASTVSKRMFAYGIAAEYCLQTGLYEEAAVWDKKYKGAIEAAYKAAPCKRISSRRWV